MKIENPSNSNQDIPPIPARMLNEYVYCPRLAYIEWVNGEFTHNEFTVDGAIKHKRIDKKAGKLPESVEEWTNIHAKSIELSSENIGAIAKIDLVEGQGKCVMPVDYKRGKRPHIAGWVYQPERVQLCVQGLLLREHGFECNEGIIYFVASKERIKVVFDETLISETLEAIADFKKIAAQEKIPEPLVESRKCPKCSLVGICLPDEIAFLNNEDIQPRPIYPAVESALPLYVQSPQAYVRKDGKQFIIEEKGEKISEARIREVSQIVLFGSAMMSSPALHECFKLSIPVTYMSYSGWFKGHAFGTENKNVETRIAQYRSSFDPSICLRLSKGFVAAKIANCRILLRRNWRGTEQTLLKLMDELKSDFNRATRAKSMETLLGEEGIAANRYFGAFQNMIKPEKNSDMTFDFSGRNRRPPKDPVNAMLSFAYAMLTREWTVALSAVGLDHYRGFFHQPRFGRPGLSLDMMEEFRPIIADSVVITAINKGEIQPKNFIHAVGSCILNETGRKKFISVFDRRISQEITHPIFKYTISYRRLFEVQARLLIRYLTGEITQYPHFMIR